mmetsp:Transcript_32578/g.56429  ORF Transcript_32578/g.56429 Transcript_32578/m.56429 type:complete len:199 (+) Transcript_32578:256-852(+)
MIVKTPKPSRMPHTMLSATLEDQLNLLTSFMNQEERIKALITPRKPISLSPTSNYRNRSPYKGLSVTRLKAILDRDFAIDRNYVDDPFLDTSINEYERNSRISNDLKQKITMLTKASNRKKVYSPQHGFLTKERSSPKVTRSKNYLSITARSVLEDKNPPLKNLSPLPEAKAKIKQVPSISLMEKTKFAKRLHEMMGV